MAGESGRATIGDQSKLVQSKKLAIGANSERENRREWRDNEHVRENEKGKNELGVLKPFRERVFLSMH